MEGRHVLGDDEASLLRAIEMAKIAQPVKHLQCRRCNGYGFTPIINSIEKTQTREETCPRCGGDGTILSSFKLVATAAPAGQKKLKKLTLEELDGHVRGFAQNLDLHVRLGFNSDEDGRYHGYVWWPAHAREEAIAREHVWSAELTGYRLVGPPLRLAAPSLIELMQLLGTYEPEEVFRPPSRA